LVEKAVSARGTVIGAARVGAGILVVEVEEVVEVAGKELEGWLDCVAGAVWPTDEGWLVGVGWLVGGGWATTDRAEAVLGAPINEHVKQSAPNQTAARLDKNRRLAKDIPEDCLTR
jgi:hypothetical protein